LSHSMHDPCIGQSAAHRRERRDSRAIRAWAAKRFYGQTPSRAVRYIRPASVGCALRRQTHCRLEEIWEKKKAFRKWGRNLRKAVIVRELYPPHDFQELWNNIFRNATLRRGWNRGFHGRNNSLPSMVWRNRAMTEAINDFTHHIGVVIILSLRIQIMDAAEGIFNSPPSQGGCLFAANKPTAKMAMALAI